MDLKGSIPTFIRITAGYVHDVNFLDDLILEPGAIYIMDRAYLDFARLYTFTQNLSTFISSDFNTTSFNWWMETTAEGGRATPEYGNATGFNRWLFTLADFRKNSTCSVKMVTRIYRKY